MSLGDTTTNKTNKNEYALKTIPEHSTNKTKHSNYKYTYYQNTQTIAKHPTNIHTYIHTYIYTHTHTHYKAS